MEINPALLKEIYKLITSQNPPKYSELKKKYCPDVSHYKDKILVRLYYTFENQYIFFSNEIIDMYKFSSIKWDEKIKIFNFPEENKEIELTLNDMIVDIIDDKYSIYSFVKANNFFVKDEDDGYLINHINERDNVVFDSDEYSDEYSDN